MTRFILAAGVATLAISAPAASAPHGGHGGGNGGHASAQKPNGGGHAQQARGGGHADARVAARAQPGGHGHGNGQAQMHANAQMQARAQERQRGNARFAERAQAQHRNDARVAQRAQADHRANQVREARANEARNDREAQMNRAQNMREARANQVRDMRQNQMMRAQQARADQVRQIRALEHSRANIAENMGYGVGGCPPGLARKAVACMPPGQARKLLGAPVSQVRQLAALERMPVRLQNVYQDTPNYYYQYGNGYAYRVNRADNVVSALMPLFGAGYSVGQAFPSAYPSYGLPAAYQPFYPASSPYDYRYANGYVYQVDPYTGMIANVDPMLGYGYGYGQMMPASYAAYNVPYQYRPYYYDTSDAYYRYAPGAIYQVDPQTSLITGIAALLTGGMTVGQPMPMGYSAYNVPYDYRAQYYDTPDAMYRYANGNIYRVDPATQLVTALVASALT